VVAVRRDVSTVPFSIPISMYISFITFCPLSQQARTKVEQFLYGFDFKIRTENDKKFDVLSEIFLN
jgi:hypothetical protein